LPALPVSLPGGRPGLWRQPPRAGEHGMDIALAVGMGDEEIASLIADGILSVPAPITAPAE
jgi:crotonobetainyl-CoA:carnitine CoA-transferase CaiB-like acyl-CoA transferase